MVPQRSRAHAKSDKPSVGRGCERTSLWRLRGSGSKRRGYGRAAGRVLPGAGTRVLRSAAGAGGRLRLSAAARRLRLSAAGGRIRCATRGVCSRTLLRAGAVLARLRTPLRLWLRALRVLGPRLSSLVTDKTVSRYLFINAARAPDTNSFSVKKSSSAALPRPAMTVAARAVPLSALNRPYGCTAILLSPPIKCHVSVPRTRRDARGAGQAAATAHS